MDVNEKIAIAWLEEIKNMYTRANIYYGQYHSDIDILAIDIKKKEAWDCEIKVRTGSTKISDKDSKTNNFSKIVDTMNSGEREETIKSIIPKDFKIIKKLITTKSFFGNKIENQEIWSMKFLEEKIYVHFMDDILFESFNYSRTLKKTTNEVFQTLKLLSKSIK